MLEILIEYKPLLIILLGSLLGSLKSSIDNNKYSRKERLINFCLGFYCGTAIAHSYVKTIDVGFLGLIALTGAMIGTNILEVISDLAPELTKKYLRNKFK
ncbi:MAG: hypothetical protein D8B58_17085 [Veillonella sp.]|nr:MAG: hypothetical protein D8B58_17085 [Veillonella sp.]